jgi:hypothetical protein
MWTSSPASCAPHGDKIAAHTLATYQPLYDLKPEEDELETLDRLGKNRKALPGQSEAGLLPTQKHAAISVARAMRKHSTSNLQGEMGLGKTTIALAVIELLEAYPAFILCPPHLVPKWIREAQEVIPGVHARELRRIGQWQFWPNSVNDVKAFLDDYDAGKLGEKAIAVVASTSAKMGAGWQPVVRAKTIKVKEKTTAGLHMPTVRSDFDRPAGYPYHRNRGLPEAPHVLQRSDQRLVFRPPRSSPARQGR